MDRTAAKRRGVRRIPKSDVLSQQQLVEFYDVQIQNSQVSIQELEMEISLKLDVDLERLNDQADLVQSRYDREQENFSNLQDTAVQLRNEVRGLRTLKDQYALLVESYTGEVKTLAIQIPRIELQLQKYNDNIQFARTNANGLRDLLRDAEVARADGSNNILTLESAVEPTEHIAVPNQLLPRLGVGVLLGAVLGIVAVFLFSYIRGVNWREQET